MVVITPKTKEEFESLLSSSDDRLIVIDFYATWCGPCKIMGPKFEKMSDEYKEALFIKIDVDEEEEISDSYEVKVMPTIVLIRNREKLEAIEGNTPDEVRKAIEKYK
uniref:Thioredoxin n=1 Tax=Parascaris univalens TaxID=6257 RepID=A0A914ZN27_PARUN